MHPGQKLKPGAQVVFEGASPAGNTLRGEIIGRRFHGRRLVRLWTDDGVTVDEAVDAIGHVPLPPYIKRARRPRRRSRSLPDDFRPVARIDRGAHGRPALHPGDRGRVRGPGRGDRRNHDACRLRHVSTGARRACERPHIAPERYEIGCEGRRCDQRGTCRWSARRGCRHHDDAHPRSRRARARRSDCRRHGSGRAVHLSGLRLSCRSRGC